MGHGRTGVGCVRGTAFCLLWYLSILAGFFLLYCPLLPLLILRPALYRSLTEVLFGIWELYPVALMEIMMGTRVVVVGDEIRPDERSIIVMNHRTRLDWNFLWAAMFHGARPPAHRLKIVLKSGVRHFPGPGWVMQMTCFLYIHRSWELDQYLMGKVLDFFRDIRHTCQILLFPEGTDLTAHSLQRSDKFADQHKLPRYEKVLHPKTTGFAFLSQRLRDNGQLDAVYDVTVAYPYTLPQSELDIARGLFPEEVHFRITRHSVQNLPVDETGSRDWLCSIWKDKEASLHQFGADGNNFPRELPRVHEPPRDGSGAISNALHMACLFWTLITLFAIYGIFTSMWLQIWVASHTLFFLVLSFTSDGLQHLEIALYYARNRHRNKCATD